MKRYVILLLGLLLPALMALAQTSPTEYNPDSPGDPGMPDTTSYYVLNRTVYPPMAGRINGFSYKKAPGGKQITLNAVAYTDYKFVCFRNDEGILSDKASYTFTMPYKDMDVEAVYEYAPANVNDPQTPQVTHRVVFNITPTGAGRTSYKVFSLADGETKSVSAYNETDYKFKHWTRNGMVVSAKNPMTVTMAGEDQYYTAVFEYSPATPGNPNENSFNPVTGELLVDYFSPDYLRSRMQSALGKSTWSDVERVVIKGQMNQSDAGFASGMTNVTRIDMSAVTGLTTISGNTFSSCAALTELILPPSLTRLYSNALLGCSNLSELTCMATVPPAATSASFAGLPEGVVLHVPAASLSLYKMADGWKDFFLEEAQEVQLYIAAIFPENAQMNTYADMHVCLYNRATAKVTKQVIETERLKYAFPNVEKGGTYDLYLEDRYGRQLAKFPNLVLGDEPIEKNMDNMPAPCAVTLSLIGLNGKDYADECNVRWIDSKGLLLDYGTTLKGVYEGDAVTCRVTPTDAMIYTYEPLKDTTYTVTAGENLLEVGLEQRKEYRLRLQVRDNEGNAVKNAYIQTSQRLTSLLSMSNNGVTDENGLAEITLLDIPTDLSIRAADMRDEFVQIASITELAPGGEDGLYTYDAELQIMSQAASHRLIFNLSYRLAAEAYEHERWTTPDYADLLLTMFDETDTEITGFTHTASSIYLPKALREYGRIRLHVASRSDNFEPIDIITEDFSSISVELPPVAGVAPVLNNQVRGLFGQVVEHGGLKSNVVSATTNSVALLYAPDGTLHTKLMYDADEVLFENLKAGTYTLVSMVYNPNFATVHYLDDLLAMGLKEESDYVAESITIEDGVISVTELSFIPEPVEEEVIELPTVEAETYFTANKNSVTVGNPLTLRAKVTLKSEYSSLIDHVNLVVTLPEGVDFVENSVVSARGLEEYQKDGKRVIIPLKSVLSDNVRFCVMPTIGGNYTIGATVQYQLAGKSQLRPMGAATFDAEDITINTPITAHQPHIGVSGMGPKDSKINIFDNDRLVGVTYSNPGGDWHLEIDLYKPYHYSRHEIRAEVDFEGHTLRTPTLNVDYSDETPVPALYTMIYNGKEYLFDPMRSTISESFYTYTPDVVDFTFVVDFTENDSTRISNVVFQIFNSDGSISEYNGRWQPATKNWATTMEYPSPSKVPLNVKVQYMVTPRRSADHREPFEDQVQLIYDAQQAVRKYVRDNVTVSDATLDQGIMTATVDLGGEDGFELQVWNFSYSYAHECATDYQTDYQVTSNDSLAAIIRENRINRVEAYYLDRSTRCALQVILKPKSSKSQVMKVGAVIGPDKVKEIPNITLPTIPTSTSGGWFADLGGYSDFLDDPLAPAYAILSGRGDFAQRVDDAQFLHDMLSEWSEVLRRQVYSRWNDGYYCLPDGEIQAFAAEREALMKEDSIFQQKYRQYITEYRNAIQNMLIEVLLSEIAIKTGITQYREGEHLEKMYATKEDVAVVLANKLNLLNKTGGESFDSNTSLDGIEAISSPDNSWWEWSYKEISRIHNKYRDLGSRLSKRVWSIQKWGYIPYESFGHWKSRRFPLRNIRPIIDPSGYVYEAVEGNRLEGVTATIYYRKSEVDLFGDSHEETVFWNAEEYGQKNPLVTGADGMYQWDVPEGMWQVKFEKEGYETTRTEWLPVPPPQLEINIPMVQNRNPKVVQVHAYTDRITVEFDKYMKAETLIPAFIKIMQNEVLIDASINILEADSTTGAHPERVARRIEIIPAAALEESTVTLFMSQHVSSYTARGLDGDFMEEFAIEPQITAINSVDELRVAMGETLTIEGSIESSRAAQGKQVEAVSASTLIAGVEESGVEPDSEGKFQLSVTGKMMGRTTLNISVKGYDVARSVVLNVVDRADYTTATPVASVAGGEIDRNTEIRLACEDSLAVIYYTTDGSKPTVESAVYDGTPLRMVNDTELRIAARNVADDLYMSEVVLYRYSVLIDTTAAPMASVASGDVERGIEVFLTCEDSLAVIYYTTDGSAPTAESAVYDGRPILIENDTELRIAARNVADDLYMSEVVVYSYRINIVIAAKQTTAANIQVGFTANGLLLVRTEDSAAKVTVLDLNGKSLAQANVFSTTILEESAAWPKGIYLLKIELPGTQACLTKLLKP